MEVEAAPSAVIEGSGVTVRLEGGRRPGRDRVDCGGAGRAPVMVSLAGQRILVASEPVDFRKGHDRLAAVVQNELGLDPYSGVAYVFRAKRADRFKVLWFDGTGLEQGGFAWPSVHNGVMRLSRAQFEALFECLDWRRVWSVRVRKPRTAARFARRLHRPRDRPVSGPEFENRRNDSDCSPEGGHFSLRSEIEGPNGRLRRSAIREVT